MSSSNIAPLSSHASVDSTFDAVALPAKVPVFNSEQLLLIGLNNAGTELIYAIPETPALDANPIGGGGRLRIGQYQKVDGKDANGQAVNRYNTSLQLTVPSSVVTPDPDYLAKDVITIAFSHIGDRIPTSTVYMKQRLLFHLIRMVMLLVCNPKTGSVDYGYLRQLQFGALAIPNAGEVSSITSEVSIAGGGWADVV